MPLIYIAGGAALAWIVGDTTDKVTKMATVVGVVGLGYYLFVK